MPSISAHVEIIILFGNLGYRIPNWTLKSRLWFPEWANKEWNTSFKIMFRWIPSNIQTWQEIPFMTSPSTYWPFPSFTFLSFLCLDSIVYHHVVPVSFISCLSMLKFHFLILEPISQLARVVLALKLFYNLEIKE